MGSAFSEEKTIVSADRQHDASIVPAPLRYTGAGAVMYGVV